MWDQVPTQPKPKKSNPSPCPPGRRHFGLCPPNGAGTGNGGPTPLPIPTPPFGGGILGANAVGVVLLQASRLRRRWRSRRRG